MPQALQAHHRLTELDLREAVLLTLGRGSSAVTPATLLHILERHRKLLVLRLHSPSALGEVNAAVLRSIFSLDRCHTLSLMPEANDATSWEGLPRMPALTSLEMSDVGRGAAESASRLHAVAQCTGLVHLSVSRPRSLGSEGFLRYFRTSERSHIACTLRSLVIDQMDGLSSVAVVDVQTALAGLHSLQRLHLRRVSTAHVLVQSLGTVKSLRELILEPLCSAASFAEPLWTSPAVLQDALLHNPLLHLCVRLQYSHLDDDDDGFGQNGWDSWARRTAISNLADMLQQGCKPEDRVEIDLISTRR